MQGAAYRRSYRAGITALDPPPLDRAMHLVTPMDRDPPPRMEGVCARTRRSHRFIADSSPPGWVRGRRRTVAFPQTANFRSHAHADSPGREDGSVPGLSLVRPRGRSDGYIDRVAIGSGHTTCWY